MNSNKRDIYFEGRIYVGCEKICPDEKRDFNNYWGRENSTDCDGFDREQFNHDVKQFYAYLSTLTNYPVQGSHSFKDGEDVTGKYSLMEHWNSTHTNYTHVALPTPAPVAEQDDWFDRQTMQEVKKKIIEEIDSYPKDEIKQMAAAQNYAVDKTHPFNKLFTKLTDAFIAGVEWQKQNKQL